MSAKKNPASILKKVTHWCGRKMLLISALLVLLAAVFVLVAQPWQQGNRDEKELAPLFPPHPQIYLESSDFLGQLERWDRSKVKEHWLSSDNFKQFENSRLYLRLSDKLREFEVLLERSVDLPLVKSIAGGPAALGLYSIGDLEFLFVTRVPSEAFERGPFFLQRPALEQKSAEGTVYYARSGHGHNVSYAVSQGLFLLATGEPLLRNALHNLADSKSRVGLSSDSRFQQSRASSSTGSGTDLWMFLDMEALTRSRYFQNEWLYRNVSDLVDYQTGVIEVRLEKEAIKERRRFWLKEDSAGESLLPAIGSAIPADLLQSLPAEGEFVRAASASPAEISRLVYRTLLNPLRQADQTLSLTWTEMPYEVSSLLKTDSLYFQSIDEPTISRENPEQLREKQQAEMIKRLEDIIGMMGCNAIIQCGTHQMDAQGYVRPQQAILLKSRPELLSKLKSELQSQFNCLYYLGHPSGWKKLEGEWETLGILPSLVLSTRDQVLCLGNSVEFSHRVLQQPLRPAETSNRKLHSYGRLDIGKFRPGFEAMFGWLDYPGRTRNPRGVPAFFSQNLGSLLVAASPIKSVASETWMQDGVMNEEVVYAIGSP